MFEKWENAIISYISLALYVTPNNSHYIHKNRPYHGFILNDSNSVKDYIFSDGTVMKTYENEFFYLPKGSSYKVKVYKKGNCYAINFDLKEPFSEKPFSLRLKNNNYILSIFKDACDAWQNQEPFYDIFILKSLYDIIWNVHGALKNEYLSSSQKELITHAIKEIHTRFNDSSLSVSELAAQCNISQTYFRKIFYNTYNTNPKEYITKLRINYAKQMLSNEQLSISNIATLCGYSEPCHFSREFSRLCGISPKNFKESLI